MKFGFNNQLFEMAYEEASQEICDEVCEEVDDEAVDKLTKIMKRKKFSDEEIMYALMDALLKEYRDNDELYSSGS